MPVRPTSTPCSPRPTPDARSKGISAFVVEKADAGVSFGAPEKKLGIKGSPDP